MGETSVSFHPREMLVMLHLGSEHKHPLWSQFIVPNPSWLRRRDRLQPLLKDSHRSIGICIDIDMGNSSCSVAAAQRQAPQVSWRWHLPPQSEFFMSLHSAHTSGLWVRC